MIASGILRSATVGPRSFGDQPGEIVRVDRDRSPASGREPRTALCIFEFIYFYPAPTASQRQAPRKPPAASWAPRLRSTISADVVIGDAGLGATRPPPGFAASGILTARFTINRYIVAPSSSPTPALRRVGIALKLTPARQPKGQNVVVVDDSIVRAAPLTYIVDLLRQAGAAVHVRISSPPFHTPASWVWTWPTRSYRRSKSVEGVRQHAPCR